MTAPKVSIIIPTWNRSVLLREAIKSVQAQDYENWECIVVDDGSTDDTWEQLQAQAAKDDRILIYKSAGQQKGAPACRNFGLTKCDGSMVIFLDSDDLLATGCISNRVQYFQANKDCDFLVFPVLIFNECINDLNLLWNIETEESDLLRFLKTDAVWQTSSVIYKKEALQQQEGFREDLKFWQDFDLHTRLLLKRTKYKKFLHQLPDCYHRNHVSRISAGVNENDRADILYQKINFYLRQMDFIKRHGIKLTEKETVTLWNAYMYFVNLCLTLLNNKKKYLRFWFKGLGFFRAMWWQHLVTMTYHYTFYFVEKFHLPGNIRRTFYKFFKKQIADQHILAGNSIAKITIQYS